MQMETETQGPAQELTAAIEVLVPGRGPTISGSAHKGPPDLHLGGRSWRAAGSSGRKMKLGGRLSHRRTASNGVLSLETGSARKALCRVPSLCKEAVMTGVTCINELRLGKTQRGFLPRQQQAAQGTCGRGAGITLSCPAPVDRGPSALQSTPHSPDPLPTRTRAGLGEPGPGVQAWVWFRLGPGQLRPDAGLAQKAQEGREESPARAQLPTRRFGFFFRDTAAGRPDPDASSADAPVFRSRKLFHIEQPGKQAQDARSLCAATQLCAWKTEQSV